MENPIHHGNLTFHLSFIPHRILLSTGIMMVVITIAIRRAIHTGEDMITGIILTDHTLAGFIITNVNTIRGNKATEITTVKIADKKESPLINTFLVKGLSISMAGK
jgi:hypothetical protein